MYCARRVSGITFTKPFHKKSKSFSIIINKCSYIVSEFHANLIVHCHTFYQIIFSEIWKKMII